LKEKDLFPDYQPKRTPDTVYDYLRKPDSKVFIVLSEISHPSINNLKRIIDLFKKYKIEAQEKPGEYRPSNIVLGADPDQYYPSEEEILASELGKMIKSTLETYSKQKIEEVKQREGITSQTLEFNEIYYRHVDVMGSGRFFYAERKNQEVKLLL